MPKPIYWKVYFWYYLYNFKVTLSLKKSDMIKSNRFWHRINKFGLRRSLNCSKAFNIKQEDLQSKEFATATPLPLHCYDTASPLIDRQIVGLSAACGLWRPSSINGRLRSTECAIKLRFAHHMHSYYFFGALKSIFNDISVVSTVSTDWA